MIEKAYFLKNLSELRKLPTDADRLYIGSDYCIKALPKNFEYFLIKIKSYYPVTLLTPPILESELKIFENYMNIFLKYAGCNDEIIFNDMGALYFVSTLRKKDFKMGLGRFFSYQKRGVQKLYNAVTSEDLRDVPILDRETIAYLKKFDIERIEIDAVPYGINILDNYNMKISLYVDNIITTFTLNCPYTFNGKYWGRRCKRECLNNFLILSSNETVSEFFEKGRIFYQNTKPAISDKIDRVVSILWKRD